MFVTVAQLYKTVLVQHPHYNHKYTAITCWLNVNMNLMRLYENHFIIYAAERNVQILCQYDIICAFPLGKEIISTDVQKFKH